MTGQPFRVTDDPVVVLFIDADNLHIAAREAEVRFHAKHVVEFAREFGRVVVAKAYGDWREPWLKDAYEQLAQENVELVQVYVPYSGKNSADIRLALDALELVMSPTFRAEIVVLASGDRDFIPLVTKLRRYGVKVYGIGIEGSIAKQFRTACDRFVSYQALDPQVINGDDGSAEEELEIAEFDAGVEPQSVLSVSVEDASHEEEEVKVDQGGEKITSKSELYKVMLASANAQRVAAYREEIMRLLVKSVAAIVRKGDVVSAEALHAMMTRLDGSYSLELANFMSRSEVVRHALQQGILEISSSIQEPIETYQLTLKGRELLGFEPRSPKELAKEYTTILARSNVSILPKVWRDQLIYDLWNELEELPGSMTMAEVSEWLRETARARHGFIESHGHFRKLAHALNLAKCFEDADGIVRELELQEWVRKGVPAEAAIHQIEVRYVRKIRIEQPGLELSPEAISIFLFGSAAEKAVEQASSILAEIQRPG